MKRMTKVLLISNILIMKTSLSQDLKINISRKKVKNKIKIKTKDKNQIDYLIKSLSKMS
jgi:hypothetical protein